MGLIRSELYFFGIRIQKNVFYGLYRSRTNYIRLIITQTLKKLPEQTFHGLSYISKPSLICCGIFINFIAVAVFIDCNNL